MFQFHADVISSGTSAVGSVAGSLPASVAASAVPSTLSQFSVNSFLEEQLPQGSDEDAECKRCPACGGDVNKGKKYCRKHHRAFGCLETSHVKKGTPQEQEAFYSIFGRRARKATAKNDSSHISTVQTAKGQRDALGVHQELP